MKGLNLDHDKSTKEKLQALWEVKNTHDEAEEHFTAWELEFIENQHTKQQQFDVEFSTKEELKIDEIYEKAWENGLFDS